MRERIDQPGPCACGNPNIKGHLSYPIKEAAPPMTAAELRWCPMCGRATACVGRHGETYEQLDARADQEWSAAQKATRGPLPPTTALDGLGPIQRRVLAAILHLGSGHAVEQTLAVATGFGPTCLIPALHCMEDLGIISRTRCAWNGVDLSRGWAPTPPYHSMLSVFMEMIDAGPAMDERLSQAGMHAAIPQPERTPA